MLKEFKEFAMRGNVIDMAVGIVIGVAFGAVVASFVADVLMPPVGLLIGGLDFSNLFLTLKEGATPGPYVSPEAAKAAGAVTLDYGQFVNSVINFIIVAFAIFLVVKAINSLRRQKENVPAEAVANKECPYCMSTISVKASRCPHCTSELVETEEMLHV